MEVGGRYPCTESPIISSVGRREVWRRICPPYSTHKLSGIIVQDSEAELTDLNLYPRGNCSYCSRVYLIPCTRVFYRSAVKVVV